MKKLLAAITLTAVILTWSPCTASAQQREPSYLILRAPVRRYKGHTYYNPGRGYEVRTHAYAYGWFGVQPRQHLRRSTGYYDSYIQWTKQ